MRATYQRELESIERQALDGVDVALDALANALRALALHDPERAGAVIAADDHLDAHCMQTQAAALTLLARQAPVACDLRLIVALIDIATRVERVGDQCVTIAKLVALDGFEGPLDRDLLDRLALMGSTAGALLSEAKEAFVNRDVELARQLRERDRAVNALNREVFDRSIETGSDRDIRAWAMHMTLVARCLERVGDNAVGIASHTEFVATGRTGR
ncbi:MAG TPA: phosphate signaling complex protein PhoU [Conexibacter sp.]